MCIYSAAAPVAATVEALPVVDQELLDVTYPIEIERGLHIQAWALPANKPSGNGFRARLAATIRKEGIRL
jgi:hypothetical protein